MLEEEKVSNLIVTTLLKLVAKFLDYKEKEEVMRRCFKLKDSTYSVREDFSEETVEICKNLWDQV